MLHKEEKEGDQQQQQQKPLSNLEDLKIVSANMKKEYETQPLPELIIEESKQPQVDTSKQASSKKSMRMIGDGRTHVTGIGGTKLLVFLNQSWNKCANMEMYDISNKDRVKKLFTFEEVVGITGYGDVTYNSRRNILGAISLSREITYHLFIIDIGTSKTSGLAKLARKSKWHPQYSTNQKNWIAGLDFHPNGALVATIDRYGVCMISDINTDRYYLSLNIDVAEDAAGRCRWGPNSEDSFLYVKYDKNKLNILDVEKKVLTLKKPVQLEERGWTCWIDVCQNDGNLLASGGWDSNIKIYDQRQSKIAKTFNDIHKKTINCVRWNSSGDMLATASDDKTAKVIEFKTGKVLFTGTTPDNRSKIGMLHLAAATERVVLKIKRYYFEDDH